MNNLKKTLLAVFVFVLFNNNLYAVDNGEITIKNGQQLAWNEDIKQWTSIEIFWRNHAKLNGGLTWNERETFPPYNDVKEFDLFMAKTDQGICLMEFYHTRWRRANDVRRWDNQHNEYSACSTILN